MSMKWFCALVTAACVTWFGSGYITPSSAENILPMVFFTATLAAAVGEVFRRKQHWDVSAWCSSITVLCASVLGPIITPEGLPRLLWVLGILYIAGHAAEKRKLYLNEKKVLTTTTEQGPSA